MAAWPRAAHQKWLGGVRKSLFSRSWCAAWPLFYHERFQEEGFLWLFMSSQKHKLPSSSTPHIMLPAEQQGLTEVMNPVSISVAWRIHFRRSRALPWWRNRWVWLGVGCCWSAEISAFQFGWREKWVGSSRQRVERERERDEYWGRTGLGWQELWISQRIGFALHHRAGAEGESWCVLWLVFASRMTVFLQTDYGWFCDPFFNFCFVLVSLFLKKLCILGALSCAVYVLNKQYSYYLVTYCSCIIP